jgi:hypothetical protein
MFGDLRRCFGGKEVMLDASCLFHAILNVLGEMYQAFDVLPLRQRGSSLPLPSRGP